MKTLTIMKSTVILIALFNNGIASAEIIYGADGAKCITESKTGRVLSCITLPSNQDGSTTLDLSAVNDNIIMALEEPANGSVYSGVSNIRGWTVAPVGIKHIELSIDGNFITNIPSGGQRSDVGSAYPNYPDSNQSGFSMAFNYSNLTEGVHRITIKAVDNNDGIKSTEASFSVARFKSSFISDSSSISLSAATVSYNGASIIIENLLADNEHYNLRLDWRTATQGFAITQITPVAGQPSSLPKPGTWRGTGSNYTVCFNVSQDSSMLTDTGSNCTVPSGSASVCAFTIKVISSVGTVQNFYYDDTAITNNAFSLPGYNIQYSPGSIEGRFTSSTTASGSTSGTSSVPSVNWQASP